MIGDNSAGVVIIAFIIVCALMLWGTVTEQQLNDCRAFNAKVAVWAEGN